MSPAPPVDLMLYGVAAFLALAVLGVFAGRRRWAGALIYGGSLAVAVAATGVALSHLLSAGPPDRDVLPLGLPWIGARFRLDALSAAFAVVIDLGAAAASLYAIGYGRHEAEPYRVLPFYPAFLAGMNLALLADDAFSFLVAWEVMSLASWALVLARHRQERTRFAAYVYLIMASFGALCLLLAFGLLAGPSGGYAFDSMRAATRGGAVGALVFALAVLGAGSKAGLVPLHAWLPLAHPAAPSHVSALMSGVMTKVAVYAFIRIVFDLAGPPQAWEALVVLGLGSATAVIGVLYAIVQSELKRMLAYSTVENVGVVFIGLGLALAFKAAAMPAAAALAMTAALFHVLNHAVFKSLLFMGAGAVLHATGQDDLDRMGGLIRRLPTTAFLVLAGCVSISALPPLNGFVSEWLTFQAVLVSPQLPDSALKLAAPAAGGMLALTAALTAAAFVRLYGVAFLGRARSDEAAQAHETDRWSLAAMAAMAALCLAAGVLPGFVIDALSPVVSATVGGVMPSQASHQWLSIVPVAEARSSYNGLLVLVFVTMSAGLAALTIHRLASRAVRRAPAWDCGFPDPSPATQYTASSFAQPIRRVFAGPVFGARDEVIMPEPGAMSAARFRSIVPDPIWDRLYAPVALVVGYAADHLNALQFLTIRLYLTLVFAALVGLLLVLAIWL